VLADVVAEAVAGLASRAIERRIDLGVTETNRATLRGDAALLGVLVRNLVDNAIQHSQENARVDVAIDSAPEVVTLTVTDSGPGIPVEERPRVLERFYRMRDTRASGTGLGLSIVQKIAELHAATVTFEDAPHPPGLRVCVRFPRPHDVTETDT
jgi:signal transduction histidine kinase